MKFQFNGQSWEVERASAAPYVRTVDCRLPARSAEYLATKLTAINPSKIELLGMRAYRDHVSRQYHYWGFRLTTAEGQSIVEILHAPDMSVRAKMR